MIIIGTLEKLWIEVHLKNRALVSPVRIKPSNY
jgi:hypothetical protein